MVIPGKGDCLPVSIDCSLSGRDNGATEETSYRRDPREPLPTLANAGGYDGKNKSPDLNAGRESKAADECGLGPRRWAACESGMHLSKQLLGELSSIHLSSAEASALRDRLWSGSGLPLMPTLHPQGDK